MSDISVAPEQDAIAESLLGEPEEQQTVEQAGTEQPEVVEQEPEQVEAGEVEQEEVADDWLPTDQDKVFPDEIYSRYASRYGLTPEQAADPQLRQLLTDKINTDVFVRQQQQLAEQYQEPEPEPQPEPTQPQISREQYFANLDRVIAERTDPQVAKDFHGGFLRAFGVPEAQIAQMPPQQAMQFTSLMSKYALNLFSTFFPDMLSAQLPQHMSTAYPGFGDMYERSSYAMAWDQVRNSNPQYSGLPAYGTKEFSKVMHEAESRFPELVKAFEGPDGKIPSSKAGQAYSLLARIASGQSVDPQLLAKAVNTGASNARRAAVRRSAGNLGSGQSANATGHTNSSKFQSNQDLFDDETMELYKREHGRL